MIGAFVAGWAARSMTAQDVEVAVAGAALLAVTIGLARLAKSRG